MRTSYKNQLDNRGIAMVSVLLTIMLCFLLSGTILRLSYLALLSRNVDQASANTFYDAESVVDDIRMNLQKASAAALSVTGTSDGAAFISTVHAMLTNGDSSLSDVENAEQYIAKNIIPGATIDIQGDITTTNDSLVIHDVYVTYIDPETEYESRILTDIRVKAPYFASSEKPPLGSYTMFAGGGANVLNTSGASDPGNSNQYGHLTQEGNVYIGYMEYDAGTQIAKACDIAGGATLYLDGENVVINGDIYLREKGNLVLTGQNIEIRGVIYITGNSHLVIGETTNLVAQDIVIDNASVFEGQYSSGPLKIYSKGLPREYYNINNDSNDYLKNTASVVYYSGGICYDALVSNKIVKTQSGTPLSGVMLFGRNSAECKPHPNILGPDGKTYYDEMFLQVIDVEYFSKFCDTNMANYKQPRTRLVEGKYRVTAANKYIVDVVDNECVTGNDLNYSTFQYAEGKTYTVEVNVGNNTEVVNATNSNKAYIIFKEGDIEVAMNDYNDYVGIFLCTGTLKIKKSGAQTYGRSLLAADQTTDKKYLKPYIDNLGKLSMDDNPANNKNVFNYTVINNFFNGGIKTFYESAEIEDNTGGSTITEENQIDNLIELENWNKQ